MADETGVASSGFAVTGPRFHVWDEDAPTVEAWARELAAIAVSRATLQSALPVEGARQAG